MPFRVRISTVGEIAVEAGDGQGEGHGEPSRVILSRVRIIASKVRIASILGFKEQGNRTYVLFCGIAPTVF